MPARRRPERMGGKRAASTGKGRPVRALLQPVRIPRRRLFVATLWAAFWGMLVDMNRIPILAPTGNSTIWQATTAASFALLGILGGPFIGALGGLLRDGTFAVVSGAAHPYLISSVWALLWGADILEDVVLGLVPGIAARYTRRIDILAGVSAATAWLSLPCMLTADAIIVGQPDRIGHVLITMTGNWDQPVDPGLAVYGFLTGAIVALALTLWSKPRKTALRVVAILGLAAVVLMELGAHT